MNYANGKIYQITNIDHTKCYIGSTTHSLSRRFSLHKSNYKQWQEGKVRKCSVFDLFNEYGVDNCYIDLVEAFECKNRTELERKEGEVIKITDCINKNIAGRTLKEYHKEYYLDNKKIIKQWQSTRYNCICGRTYQNSDKSHHLNTDIHKNYIKNQIKKISGEDYQFIFECDSLSLIPSTYPNYIISN